MDFQSPDFHSMSGRAGGWEGTFWLGKMRLVTDLSDPQFGKTGVLALLPRVWVWGSIVITCIKVFGNILNAVPMSRTTAKLSCCLLDCTKIWLLQTLRNPYEETRLCSILSSVIPQCHELYLMFMPALPNQRQWNHSYGLLFSQVTALSFVLLWETLCWNHSPQTPAFHQSLFGCRAPWRETISKLLSIP